MRYTLSAGACAALLTVLVAAGPVASMQVADEVPDPPELPQAIHKVDPIYPPEAREAGVDGNVGVQVLIGKDGKVKDTRVVKSIPTLDAAAVAAARRWLFTPAHDPNGRPVAVWVLIPFTFKIPAPPDSAHAEFDKAARELRDLIGGPDIRYPPQPPSKGDEAIREHVIRMSLQLKPPPVVLAEVRDYLKIARAELDSSTSASNARALEHLSVALFRAPWFADAYLEAARALEAAARPADAAVALRLYLVADPTSSRRGAIERRLKKLGSNETH